MTVLIDKSSGKVPERPRHPEKAHKPDSEVLRKPSWIRVKAPTSKGYSVTRKIVRDKGLVTVCEEAACPNIGECWEKSHATFMILGDTCTRACAFCNIKTGLPGPIDVEEPAKIAMAVKEMGLSHVVITSVDRDDLADGGAQHFVDVIQAIRAESSKTTIEILTPDFLRKDGAAEAVIKARPDVFNHNLETVPRLYKEARPGADYAHSLDLLREFKKRYPGVPTKSGIMVGLGENDDEIYDVIADLRRHGADMLTVGQYLQPTRGHLPVRRFVPPPVFEDYRRHAEALGFSHAACGPLVRSSYHADQQASGLVV